MQLLQLDVLQLNHTGDAAIHSTITMLTPTCSTRESDHVEECYFQIIDHTRCRQMFCSCISKFRSTALYTKELDIYDESTVQQLYCTVQGTIQIEVDDEEPRLVDGDRQDSIVLYGSRIDTGYDRIDGEYCIVAILYYM